MREFRIGPWVGEFGHWILYVQPFINALRYLYPDSHITVATFEEEEIYLDNIHDAFVGYPWWPARRGRAICEDIPMSVQKIAREFNPTHSTYQLSQPDFKKSFQSAPLLLRRRIGPPPDINNNRVVFATRTQQNVQDTSRNWTEKKWKELAQLFINEGWTVAACGPQIDYFQDEVEKHRTCVEVASKSYFGIGDAGGGQHTLNYCGVPTVIHAPSQWAHLYNLNHPSHCNFLETLNYFIPTSMAELTPEQRFTDAIEFINFIKEKPRHKYIERFYKCGQL